MKTWIITIMLILLALANPVSAWTVFVDATNGNDSNGGLSETNAKQSIGVGLSIAVSGDEVLVLPGIYVTSDLSFNGEDIELRSRDGASSTIIDCAGQGRAFVFNTGETTNALLSGFTLRNGQSTLGGSIWIDGASPRIENCIFEDNQVVVEDVFGLNGSSDERAGESATGYTARGGAVFIQGGTPHFRLCQFQSNSASGGKATGGDGGLGQGFTDTYFGGAGGDATGGNAFGGALYVAEGSCLVERCEFRQNQAAGGVANGGDGNGRSDTPCYGGNGGNAYGGSAAGAAIYVLGDGAVEVANCVFWHNITQGGDGGGGDGGRSDQGYVFGGGSTAGSDNGGDGGNGTGGGANGGAVAGALTNVLINFCTFADNTASGGSGVGGTEGYPHTDDNSDGAGSNGNGYGGAVYGGSVVNSILWDNTANSGLVAYNSSVIYSVVDDGTTGAGNVSGDPYFVRQETGDLRIGYGSSAMDVADAGNSPTLDLNGVIRPQLSGFDMGAYEMLDDVDSPRVVSVSPSNGTFIDRRDITIDVCFSERVQGVDISDLVLSGSSSTGAVVAAAQLIDGRYTYRFTVNELSAGSLEIQFAPDAGDITDIIGNNQVSTNWSYSVDPILIYHVRSDVSDSGDGRTWATAKKTLAEAVAIAEGRTEIWVQHGTYSVGSITIPRELTIRGGFEGDEERSEERPVLPQPTEFRDGQLNITAGCTSLEDIRFVDGAQQWLVATDADLCLRRCVFSDNNITGTSRTATGYYYHPDGYAPVGLSATGDSVEGIVKVTRGELRLSECSFKDNLVRGGSATGYHGGTKMSYSGKGYYAGDGGAATGGSVYGCGVVIYEGTGVVYNCIFQRNQAVGGNATGGDGGGTSSLYFCFGGDGAGATAGSAYGAAIYGDAASSLHVYNSLFVGNNITGGSGSGGDGGYSDEHDYYGGPSSCSNGGSGRGGSALGGAVYGAGKLDLVNCTSVGNTSVAGSGLGGSAGSGSYLRDGYPGSSINGTGSHGGCYGGAEGSLAANSIFFQDLPNDAPTTNWHHCSFDDDPGFILPEAQDFRLSTDSEWMNDGTNSALPVDTLDVDDDGDRSERLPIDLAGQPRIKDGTVDVGAYEGGIVTLTVSIPSGATEGDGLLAAAGTVSIQSVLDNDLTVSLFSDDTSEISVPATATILAGSTNAAFDITIVDDDDLDGSRSASITASAGIHIPSSGTMLIQDDETTTLMISLPLNVREGDGLLAATGTVSVGSAPVDDVVVTLSSDDNSELTVSASTTILAGQTSATFDLTIIDDNEIDGTRTVSVVARVNTNWKWISSTNLIGVLDNETTNLVLTVPASAAEGDGFVSGTVSISGTLATNLSVSLVSDDTSEVVVPSSVTITAGQTSVSFDLTVLDDIDMDGAQSVTVAADASGFTSQNAIIDVADNDVHHLAFGAIDSVQTAGIGLVVTISAKDVNNEPIPSFTNAVELTGSGDGGSVSLTPTNTGAFAAGVWTGIVTVATIDTSIVLTAEDSSGLTGMSTSFDVPSGPLDHFEWSVIATTQYVDTPFPVTLTARDAKTNLVTGFEGRVDLTVPLVGGVSTSNVIIGAGSDSWNYPMSAYYHDSRTQVIYLQEEIGSSCTITSLALYVSTVPGQIMNNWTIRMKHTSLNEYSSGAVWESADWATVYAEDESIGKTGWREFTFTVPFEYNGSDNLMVDFSMNNSSYTTDGQCASTSRSPTYRSVYYRTDSGSGDPLGWPDNGYNPTRYLSYNIPNIRLGVELTEFIQVSPANTSNFVGGTWAGVVTIAESGTNLVLCVEDGFGHLGYSDVFDVLPTDGGDGDGDGIPDAWEIEFFGSATNCVANADADGDGRSNWQEYIAGTNPTNSLSCFEINEFRTDSRGFSMDWKAVTGRVYTVESRDSLITGGWEWVTNFTGTNGVMSLEGLDLTNACFYRINVELE